MLGVYDDRRNNRKVDCRNTIWILASSFGDEAIGRFYEAEMKHKQDSEKAGTSIKPLITELRDLFKEQWGVIPHLFPRYTHTDINKYRKHLSHASNTSFRSSPSRQANRP